MTVIGRAATRLRQSPRRHVVWRSLLAAPFAISLVLALILGPATVDSPHASFGWLVGWSLLAALGMLLLPDVLLILVGLGSVVAFPVLAGLGFHSAPDWAFAIVLLSFYGSIAASLAAVATGLAAVVRPLVQNHAGAAAIGAGGVELLGVAAILAILSAPARVAGEAPATAALGVNTIGSAINTTQREAEPTFSADGRRMIFNCRDNEICTSRVEGTWQSGQWSSPQLVGLPISSDYVEVEPWLNPEGDKLYVNSNRPFADGEGLPGLALYVNVIGLITGELGITPLGGVGQDEIWISYLRDGHWSELQNINAIAGEPHVNTPYMDHCLAFSADGNEAFWTSTRPGGFGRNDIWTSRRVNGTWTEPENLGPDVNSTASEHHSLPTPDGRQLQVTSDRLGGLGGEDMYAAERLADSTWGELTNLGSQINGPANDRCAAWTPDGSVFLFDSDRPDGFGSKDLWWAYVSDVALATAGGG